MDFSSGVQCTQKQPDRTPAGLFRVRGQAKKSASTTTSTITNAMIGMMMHPSEAPDNHAVADAALYALRAWRCDSSMEQKDRAMPGSWGRGSTRQSRKQRTIVLDRAGRRCQIRGPHCTGAATEDDHIIPLSQGGSDTDLTNRQAACHTCHREKSLRESVQARIYRRPPEDHPGRIT